MSTASPHAVENRRIATVTVALPPGVTPKGARGKILNAALRLFANHGFGGTSVRDICAEAQVQATTLYSHFPSKEHVLAEITKLGHEEHFARLRKALLACQPEPRLQLVALVRAHVLAHCEYAMLSVVANAELHMLSNALAAPIHAIREQSQVLLVEVIERGIRLGLFNIPDVFLALRAISGMGLMTGFWYDPGCGRTPEQVADAYAEFALRIVGASETGTNEAVDPAQ